MNRQRDIKEKVQGVLQQKIQVMESIAVAAVMIVVIYFLIVAIIFLDQDN